VRDDNDQEVTASKHGAIVSVIAVAPSPQRWKTWQVTKSVLPSAALPVRQSTKKRTIPKTAPYSRRRRARVIVRATGTDS
jgi:hypothetical protein